MTLEIISLVFSLVVFSFTVWNLHQTLKNGRRIKKLDEELEE